MFAVETINSGCKLLASNPSQVDAGIDVSNYDRLVTPPSKKGLERHSSRGPATGDHRGRSHLCVNRPSDRRSGGRALFFARIRTQHNNTKALAARLETFRRECASCSIDSPAKHESPNPLRSNRKSNLPALQAMNFREVPSPSYNGLLHFDAIIPQPSATT